MPSVDATKQPTTVREWLEYALAHMLLKDVHGAVREARKALDQLEAGKDAEMERLKACEHIAEGDKGWEKLRELCPSTVAVAKLRDEFQELKMRTRGQIHLSPRIKDQVAEAHEHAKRVLVDAGKIPPVDRDARELVSGQPVPEDNSHTELKSNGQQQDYVVLSAEERAKGFVRPVRRSYVHQYMLDGSDVPTVITTRQGMGGCGALTTMSLAIAETYARDPEFYSGTFCVGCSKHLPLDQFVWDGTNIKVGT